MINIYILWHFKNFLELFFIFWNKYINSHMCLVIFSFLFIKKKIKKTIKCIDIDIAISTSKILIILSNLNNMLSPIPSFAHWFLGLISFFWHVCSLGGSLTSGRCADLPQQAVYPHSVRTAPSQPAAAAGAPAGVKRRNHENQQVFTEAGPLKSKKTNK